MKKVFENYKYIILFIIFSLYLVGFFLKENIAGGAKNDFQNFTWPVILSFKENFLFTIKNYGNFGEGSLPLFHIINAYFNPFNFREDLFQFSITILSLLNVVIFSQILRFKYKLDFTDSYLYSSIFLILPFFRSSAFWGLTENLGWLFLILSVKYYLLPGRKQINIFLICFFSSLALYTRPYLIFFPIFFIIELIIKKEYFILKAAVIYYAIFSIPGFILLYIWGGSVYLNTGGQRVNFILEYHQPKFIPKNLVIFSSICFFYFLPFHLISILKKKYLKKEIVKYVIPLIGLLILYNFNIFDYLKNENLGGGAFLKVNKYFFNENNIFFLIISYFGIISLIEFIKISKKNFLLIIVIIIIYCTAKFLYQEYFEPLLLIVFLSLFDLKKEDINILKSDKTILKFIFYFLVYFCSSYYFRYNLAII